jgi:excisionase family DNA binding protein
MYGPNRSTHESAKYLGISRAMLYKIIAAGEIVPIKIGRATQIPTSELEQYIARRLEVARGGGEAA